MVDFNPQHIEPGAIAKLLASIGYTPRINLNSETESGIKKNADKTLVIKLAVAGFCFGNVMLFSFPEYLGLDYSDEFLQRVFCYLNLGLSIPVFFYSGGDYFRACIQSIKLKQINIDVPIAVGLLALFSRSTYDIVSGFGPGYFDSLLAWYFFF